MLDSTSGTAELEVYLFVGHIIKANVHSPGMWGGGAQSVGNGTSAWGQASEAATGWGDTEEPSKASGWGNPSPNPTKLGKNGHQA